MLKELDTPKSNMMGFVSIVVGSFGRENLGVKVFLSEVLEEKAPMKLSREAVVGSFGGESLGVTFWAQGC